MRTRLAALLLTATAAVLAAVVAATTSAAVTATWNVKPGGHFQATAVTATPATLTDTSARATTITCTSSVAAGTLTRTSNGTPLGSITSFTFTSCGAGNTVTMASGPLPLDANTYAHASGVTHAKITGISATLVDSTCTATATGNVNVKYKNGTRRLTFTGFGTLHISSAGSGCSSIFVVNDPMTLTGTYKVTPPQSIFGP
jgi:hypothetical protein